MTEAQPEIDRPTTVYAEYWPAAVLLPSGEIRRRCRVYLTDTGLQVFYTRPVNDMIPGFTAPIDFSLTAKPDIHARNVGVDVVIVDDLDGEPIPSTVVITPQGGCGCGASLRYWRPTWAHDTSPWPAS